MERMVLLGTFVSHKKAFFKDALRTCMYSLHVRALNIGRVYSTVNGRRFSNTNAPLTAADSQIRTLLIEYA